METLNNVWTWLVPFFTSGTFTIIITAILIPVIKGIINKSVSKINAEKVSADAVKQGIDKIKKVSFTQNIEPLVKSEMQKVVEMANQVTSEQLSKVQDKYDKLIKVLEKLSAYFDNSIGVSETAKTELKEAIEEAKNDEIITESVIAVVEEPVKVETKKITKNDILL